MDRYNRRVRLRRSNRVPHKQDTPVKAAPKLREKCKRFLKSKECHTLLEEPEVDMNEPADQPVVKAKKKSDAPKVPQPPCVTIKETPALKILKMDEIPESVMCCSMEPDLVLNSEEDDDDEDSLCLSSSTILSSFPSPEIFRKESSVFLETPNEELDGLHLQIKNSTLLDVSHAENIQMYPPNLSTIIDASTIVAEKNSEISDWNKPEHLCKIQTGLLKSDCSLKRKTSQNLTERMPVVCKKKVCFRSPITAESFKAKCRTSNNASQLSSPPENTKLDTSKIRKSKAKMETSPLSEMPKWPVSTCSEEPEFFYFASDSERDAFFQKARERCAKLKSAIFFPFALGTQNPLLCDS